MLSFIFKWCWKQLSSRGARLVYLVLAMLIIVPAIGFRIHAALFQRHADKLLSELSTFQVGTTTKTEALSRMPELRLQNPNEKIGCDGKDCYSVETFSAFSRWVFDKVSRTNSDALYSTLSLWGIRYWELGVFVEFESGTVHRTAYSLMISIPERSIADVIMIAAVSNTHFPGRIDPRDDESPNYKVDSHWRSPDQNLSITFIPGAENEFIQHAFHLHFGCLWSLMGCRKAREIAPEAAQDQQAFGYAAYQRLKGSDPCPDRLLPRRVRDRNDILLVEVARVGPTLNDPYSNDNYKVADFRTVKVLKGRSERPLLNVRVDQSMWRRSEHIPNPAFVLLKPGQRFLLFSRYDNSFDEPCEAVAATNTALQTLTNALKQ